MKANHNGLDDDFESEIDVKDRLLKANHNPKWLYYSLKVDVKDRLFEYSGFV